MGEPSGAQRRLRLDLERFAESSKADALLVLEAVLEETKRWPEVPKAFQDALALYQQRDKCGPTNPPGSNPIKPDESLKSAVGSSSVH